MYIIIMLLLYIMPYNNNIDWHYIIIIILSTLLHACYRSNRSPANLIIAESQTL